MVLLSAKRTRPFTGDTKIADSRSPHEFLASHRKTVVFGCVVSRRIPHKTCRIVANSTRVSIHFRPCQNNRKSRGSLI